jgi:hypothetical protein
MPQLAETGLQTSDLEPDLLELALTIRRRGRRLRGDRGHRRQGEQRRQEQGERRCRSPSDPQSPGGVVHRRYRAAAPRGQRLRPSSWTGEVTPWSSSSVGITSAMYGSGASSRRLLKRIPLTKGG